MSETASGEAIPQRMRVISGSTLKVIALIAMLIDHTAGHLLKHIPACTEVWISTPLFELSAVRLLRIVGRTAFPIYAFLIAEGAFHTRSRKRYAANLLAFALISEIPWNLEHKGKIFLPGSQNVFFTLFCGLMLICIYEVLRDSPVKCAAALCGVLALSVLLRSDYGMGGAGLVFVLYLLRERRIAQCIGGVCLCSAKYYAFPAFFLIFCYNGKRGFVSGRALKYLFYAAYPIHLMIIWLVIRQNGWSF